MFDSSMSSCYSNDELSGDLSGKNKNLGEINDKDTGFTFLEIKKGSPSKLYPSMKDKVSKPNLTNSILLD